MILSVWTPLLVPLVAAPAARRLADVLPPRWAAWLLTATAALLAACSTAVLCLLAGAGALRLPRWRRSATSCCPWSATR
ncbi:hypothetical protein [Actinacidiphila yeochonensis]|uniref:hypothetical protein n=1 Tax=Actinacidiphila yeochonensis TaxID=89050 RepID=UPI000A9DFA7B|nr:hypothetical protein [Actinacidiphila yeochonensis]